jgi:predicted PurR-regulated permease PerM
VTTRAAAPAEADEPGERPEMPLPTDPKTIFLGGLFFIALMTVCYVAQEIILPIVLACVLKLLLEPVVRTLHRLYVPRPIGALIAIIVLFGVVSGFAAAVSGPATSWAQKLPSGLPRLEQHLEFLTKPIDNMRSLLQKAEQVTQNQGEQAVTVKGPGIAESLLASTRVAAGGLFTTVLLLFFLLISGDTFLRRVVEILPRFSDKRQAVEIAQQVEHDMSIYLVTITCMNMAVGIATGIMTWACGLGDPVLWGSVAFLLNYVVILGPMTGVVMFLFVGLLSFDELIWAMLPAALYLTIHIMEGEVITPMLLARRFTLNPVMVILSLIAWFWMWSVPGAILAVPILAITKIICDRIRPLMAFGHFLEGSSRRIIET